VLKIYLGLFNIHVTEQL